MRIKHITKVALLLGAASLQGCATNGEPQDPLEPMNRAIHSFNDAADRAVIKPVAEGYHAVAPDFVETGIRNFFSNLDDISVLANDLLQLKGEQAAQDFMRLALNSTLGFVGILDIASEAGLKKHDEDFGQTLGHWGVGTGPYLVLPFLGPSNFRDTAGRVVDSSYADPIYNMGDMGDRNQTLGLRLISRRTELLEAKEAVETAALDEYSYMRDMYLDRRQNLVYDGKPPREEEE